MVLIITFMIKAIVEIIFHYEITWIKFYAKICETKSKYKLSLNPLVTPSKTFKKWKIRKSFVFVASSKLSLHYKAVVKYAHKKETSPTVRGQIRYKSRFIFLHRRAWKEAVLFQSVAQEQAEPITGTSTNIKRNFERQWHT